MLKHFIYFQDLQKPSAAVAMPTGSDGETSDAVCTPMRSDRLFSPRRTNSTSKRRLFHDFTNEVLNSQPSDSESDLGIMSPLNLSDKSNNTSQSAPESPVLQPIDTKCFYGSPKDIKRDYSFCFPKAENVKMRRRTTEKPRKHKKSKAKGSHRHGLKRPRSKPTRVKVEKRARSEPQMPTRKRRHSNSSSDEENHNDIDPTKRFFKTTKLREPATVTMNAKIKLRFSEGRVALSEKNNQIHQYSSKKLKLDATDLVTDEPQEPEIEAVKETNDVERLLKVLDDDWGTDEFDIMGSVPIAPIAQNVTTNQDFTMSPSSELTSLTSIMKIQDSTAIGENAFVPAEEPRLYPLFNKGFKDTTEPELVPFLYLFNIN